MIASPPPKPKVTSVVIPKAAPVMQPPPKELLKGDRSLDDFVIWVQNFGVQGTGHFLDLTAAKFASEVLAQHIMEVGEGYMDLSKLPRFLDKIKGMGKEDCHIFFSQAAADDFARQVKEYIELDEFIGEKPNARKQNRDGGRRRKTS